MGVTIEYIERKESLKLLFGWIGTWESDLLMAVSYVWLSIECSGINSTLTNIFLTLT